MTHVTAAIIRKDDKILICRRGAGGSCAFLWEFPGGKQEQGETPEQCLIRECKEELEIEIALEGVFAETTYQYPDGVIAFTFFKAVILKGELKPAVHHDFQWVSPHELRNYDFCPADEEVVKRLHDGKL